MTFAFTLPIEPVAWGRVKRGRYGQTYVPPKTLRYERDVARLARQHAPPTPLTGPVSLVLTFMLPRPKRCKRTFPSVRPDVDNFCKAIFDSFNGLFWKDDGQIVSLTAFKFYTGGSPSVGVQIRELEKTK